MNCYLIIRIGQCIISKSINKWICHDRQRGVQRKQAENRRKATDTKLLGRLYSLISSVLAPKARISSTISLNGFVIGLFANILPQAASKQKALLVVLSFPT